MKIISKTLAVLTILSLILIVVGFLIGGSITGIKKVFNDDHKYIKLDNKAINEDVSVVEVTTHDRIINVFETTSESYIEMYIDNTKETIDYIDSDGYFHLDLQRNRVTFPWVNYTYVSKKYRTIDIYISTYSNIDLIINNKSGVVNVKDINSINKLEVNVSSGVIKLSNILELDELKLVNKSGIINIDNISSENSLITVISGVIKSRHLVGESLQVTNKSGVINLVNHEVFDNNIKVTSGKIVITDNRPSKNIGFVAKTKSGTIRINGSYKDELQDDLLRFLIKYNLEAKSGTIKFN